MKLLKLAQSYYINYIRTLSLISKKKAANEAFELFCTPYQKLKYKPVGFLNTAEKQEVVLQGIKLAGYRWNRGGSKKVLIAHGFRSSAVNFTHIVKRLTAKGYEVLAFDAPAHGLSEGKKITAIQYRDMMHLLIKTYNGFDGFIGHSFGCMAMAFATAELPDNEKTKLVFVAPASDMRSLSQMYFRQMKIKDTGVQELFINKIEGLIHQPIEWLTIGRCMHSIKGPVLWVHDKNDRVTPIEDARKVQELGFPNIEFYFTEGLGHRRIYRDEATVEKIINFV